MHHSCAHKAAVLRDARHLRLFFAALTMPAVLNDLAVTLAQSSSPAVADAWETG